MSSLPPHEEIIFPALSPTMETGTIARWVKREGEQVEADEVLAEIETDKATVDYNATDEGFVAKILVDEGVPDVEVGSVIAIMVESGGYRRFRITSRRARQRQRRKMPLLPRHHHHPKQMYLKHHHHHHFRVVAVMMEEFSPVLWQKNSFESTETCR